MEPQSTDQVLRRLQEGLESLQLNGGMGSQGFDFGAIPPSKGAGPRLFCGHVPKEVTEDLVKAHFSRWGVVTDVYFPRHKKTLKRRPFCFVTFVSREAAERALAESPLNICGIPIKNLTMVEDRDKYYQEKQVHAQQALLAALQTLGSTANVTQDQINNLAAMLVMEGVGADAILSAASIQQQQQQCYMPQYVPQFNSAYTAVRPSLNLSDSGSGHDTMSVRSDPGAVLAALRSSGGMGPASPIPQSMPFMNNHMMGRSSDLSRESSLCSLSSADWFSSTSSRRTSMDIPGANGMPQTGRLSLDAGIHHMHHLRSGGGVPQYGMPLQTHRMPPQHNMASALQSGFYGQPAGVQQQQQGGVQGGISAAAALQSAFFAPSTTTATSSSAPASPVTTNSALPLSNGSNPPGLSNNLAPITEGVAARCSQEGYGVPKVNAAANATANAALIQALQQQVGAGFMIPDMSSVIPGIVAGSFDSITSPGRSSGGSSQRNSHSIVSTGGGHFSQESSLFAPGSVDGNETNAGPSSGDAIVDKDGYPIKVGGGSPPVGSRYIEDDALNRPSSI